jgi:hypothetical protein
MSVRPWSGVSLAGLLGVREAARAHSLVRNRRGPSAQPASGKDQGYKPMVKTFGGQRESDGVVVPLIGVQHNAPGGKGPNFDHACEVGKREGMTGLVRSNSPGRPLSAVAVEGPLVASPVKVRELQRTLWTAAKQSEGRRFHALYDRIRRGDVLWEAWERVRENRGAAGVDRITYGQCVGNRRRDGHLPTAHLSLPPSGTESSTATSRPMTYSRAAMRDSGGSVRSAVMSGKPSSRSDSAG